jgi:lipoyl(octanoyl) transferase
MFQTVVPLHLKTFEPLKEMNKTQLQDLGNKDYKETWEYQEELFKGVDLKIRNRREELTLAPKLPLFVEHPHVYTLGKSGFV